MQYRNATIGSTLLLALAMLGASSVSTPATAQLLGGKDSGALVTLGSGSAGDKGTVNLGLGRDKNDKGSGNLVDLNVGGSRGADANVSTHTDEGDPGASVDLGLGGRNGLNADTDVRLGGTDGIGADIDIGIGGDGNGGGGPGDGPGDGPGGGDGNGGGLFGNGSGSGSSGTECAGNDPRRVIHLFNRTRILPQNWARYSNVEILPLRLCPQDRSAVASAINASPKANQMRRYVSSDPLLSVALQRRSYSASNVYAVDTSGRSLRLYVY